MNPPAPANHKNALPVGARLEEYEVRSLLGVGGFGITYLAHDSHLDKKVAIKEFLPAALASREADATVVPKSGEERLAFTDGLARFLMEAQTLARFNHPNIVRVYRYFKGNNTAYMVMEFEEGESLSAILRKRNTPLPQQTVEAILFPLLDGLRQIHEASFLHRDIKPANIFIRRRDHSPVLIDFGSSRPTLKGEDLTAIVTPGFAPFEQYTTNANQGPWTDIYAMGAAMFMAITKKVPPPSTDRSIAMMSQQPDPLPPLELLVGKDYNKKFLKAIDKALSVMDRDRPQSVAHWQKMLGAPAGVSQPATPLDLAVGEDLFPGEAPTLQSEELPSPADDKTIPQAPEPPPLAAADDPTVATGAPLPPTKSGPSVKVIAAVAGGVVAVTAAAFFLLQKPPAAPLTVAENTPVSLPVETQPAPAAPDGEPDGEPDANGEAPAQPAAPAEGAVADLLAQAQEDIKAMRLTSPEGENAYERFQAVLAQEPGNQAALDGLVDIGKRYVALAEKSLNKGDVQRAQGFLAKAAKVAPQLPEIALLEQAAKNAPVSASQWREPVTGMVFVAVPGGCFDMGCGPWDQDCHEDEKPLHKVCLSSFHIGQQEVTQGQWQKIMGNNPSHFKGDDLPVDSVSHQDALSFSEKLSAASKRTFRLPSEAQWEYACRSGGRKEVYGGGLEVDAVGWHDGGVFASGNAGKKTHPVGQKGANGLGIYDMNGNVWEWTADGFAQDAYARHPENNPLIPAASSQVVRGGSFEDRTSSIRCGFRNNRSPDAREKTQGVRLLLAP